MLRAPEAFSGEVWCIFHNTVKMEHLSTVTNWTLYFFSSINNHGAHTAFNLCTKKERYEMLGRWKKQKWILSQQTNYSDWSQLYISQLLTMNIIINNVRLISVDSSRKVFSNTRFFYFSYHILIEIASETFTLLTLSMS